MEVDSVWTSLLFPVHIGLMVLTAEQNSVPLLKGVIMEAGKSEQGVISL